MEQTQDIEIVMRRETEAFLNGMPDGLQERQREAVIKALEGDDDLLVQVRAARNKAADAAAGVVSEYVTPTMRLYRSGRDIAAGRRLPLLIYLHGGGWTFGSINSCSAYCQDMVAKGGLAVLAVDYRLAPRYPFPAALDDCTAAWHFAVDNAEAWGCDAKQVSIGGDSSGGNLAVATALRLDTEQRSAIRSLVLYYPVCKAYDDGSASWRAYGCGYGLDAGLMEAFNRAYAGERNAHSPYVSVGDAPDEMLRGLPPVMMISAGKDILNDQGAAFAHRIEALGVSVSRFVFPEAVHLFITVDGQPAARAKAVSLTRDFLCG